MLGIFLDIETNGLDPFKHEPLEIALSIIDLATAERRGDYQSKVLLDDTQWKSHDPRSLDVNGFSLSDMRNARSKDDIRSDIISLFSSIGILRGRAFFICQNPSFDRPFFAKIVPPYLQEEKRWPYHWLDLASMYWAKVLVNKQTGSKTETMSVSKDTIAEKMGLEREAHPHRAMNGVHHLIQCYEKVVGFPLQASVVRE